MIFGIPVVAGGSKAHPAFKYSRVSSSYGCAKCKTILVSKVKGMLDVLEEVDKDFKLVKVSFQRWAGLYMTESCVSSLKKSAKDFNSRFRQAPAAVGPQP